MTEMTNDEMFVIKRDGSREAVQFDKVLQRIRKAAVGLSVNYTRLAQLVLAEIHNDVHTSELDELAARLAVSFMTTHPDWATLAANIIISNCQMSAPATFHDAMELLAANKDARGRPAPALSDVVIAFVRENADALNAMVKHENDFLLDYFGFKTLERAYLMRAGPDRRMVETPQYMWLRVAVGIHYGSLERVQETYSLMSSKAFTHATPTLFNAGTPRPQLSSCFLMGVEDSLEGIFEALKQAAHISKYAGGIGMHVHDIRAQGSFIAGTNGIADGLVPMLRVFNNTARYVNQSGRRNGSFAVYLEPWHADVQAFLKLKSNTGSEEERARDLFYALWIPDLFMKRVEDGGDWSLFCPHEAPGLSDAVGAKFDALYTQYEKEGRARKTISAQKLWSDILVSQIETGTPYLLYKDAANLKSNQKNLGTIKSSNLCVAPETIVRVYDPTTSTERSVAIREVEDKEVYIWNGTQYNIVVPCLTGVNEHLIRVSVRTDRYQHDGCVTSTWTAMDCTPEHKFILNSHLPLDKAPRIPAMKLNPAGGDKLCSWKDSEGCLIHQTVVSVEDYARIDDTYCFTENQNHAGVFNGILTGQCTEIMEFSSPDETAVCNLASIALPYFLDGGVFNYEKLRQVVAVVVNNLNRVIDINYYPTPQTKRSNMRHRPIGIGIQGLADIFALMGIAWESEEAADLNQRIFEHLYYAALDQSNVLARRDGIYETFTGSPASHGYLQPDLWKLPATAFKSKELDWVGLRERIRQTGLRNSLLLAPMPTASTSQILGYNECIEPFTTNIYVRRTLAGEFTVVNRYLVADLMAAGQWSPDLKERIIAANGSIQDLVEVSDTLKQRYKTVWEIKQKTLIDMAADRGAFICQSQSLNLFVAEPTIARLSSMHFYAWKRGLKTGIYYLRTKPAVQAIKFTLDIKKAEPEEECLLCSA
jgi:ribonucleotide reductase alpha subunit